MRENDLHCSTLWYPEIENAKIELLSYTPVPLSGAIYQMLHALCGSVPWSVEECSAAVQCSV